MSVEKELNALVTEREFEEARKKGEFWKAKKNSNLVKRLRRNWKLLMSLSDSEIGIVNSNLNKGMNYRGKFGDDVRGMQCTEPVYAKLQNAIFYLISHKPYYWISIWTRIDEIKARLETREIGMGEYSYLYKTSMEKIVKKLGKDSERDAKQSA